MVRLVRFLFVLVVVLAAMPALSRPQPASAAITTATTFKVEATRELLIGGETRNGFIIKSDSDYVSLSACTNRTCPDMTAGTRSSYYGLRTECGTKCWVRVVNPLNGRCAVAPIEDLGPEFINDDWWKPTAERHINLRTEYAGADIARGLPAAKRGFDGNDVGYGPGLDFRSEPISTGSGIDLGERTWSDLGFSMAAGNDYAWNDATGGPLYVSVSMLWLTGEDPATADRACLGTQTIANLPTSGVLAGDVLNVASPSGVNLRATAGMSGAIVGVLAQNAKLIASGKTQVVSGATWYEARAKIGDGWVLGTSVAETTNAGILNRARNPGATNDLAGIVANTTGTAISRVTVGGNVRVKVVASGVYTNQGPRYESAKNMNLVGNRAFVGVAEVFCQEPLPLAQVTMKAWYGDGTSSPYVTMPSSPCSVAGWQRVVTPALVVDGAKSVSYVNFYVLTGGKVTAATYHVDNAAIYQLG